MALLVANNTVTTLEIKVRLRKDVPTDSWYQDDISDVMAEFANEGKFDFVDGGTYRVYSGTPATIATGQAGVVAPVSGNQAPAATPQPAKASKAKVKVIHGIKATGPVKYASRTTAKKMFENNKGHFFTAVFTKKDQSERLINCQYLKDQTGTDLGYIKVKEASLVRAAKAAAAIGQKEPTVVRNLNLQTLKAFKIQGQVYKVR